MSNIAYVRVSTEEQNTGRQYAGFENKGIRIDRYFEEKVSGKNITDRSQLNFMLQYLREGDTLYVESISRLSRSVSDFLQITKVLTEKGVALVSIKENIDTSTVQGRFVTNIFAALYEMEREQTIQRQREGIDLCLKEGRPYGRPKDKFSPSFAKNYKLWKAKLLMTNEVMNLEGIRARSTFYDKVHRYEERVLGVSSKNDKNAPQRGANQ